jgi:hypothetical protein
VGATDEGRSIDPELRAEYLILALQQGHRNAHGLALWRAFWRRLGYRSLAVVVRAIAAQAARARVLGLECPGADG